ncbi:hypothetical protein [Lactiplantibacillus plantarum]
MICKHWSRNGYVRYLVLKMISHIVRRQIPFWRTVCL